ncbi:MAG: tRNA (adenosine(37)-N6)-threonylcarbamoyltransferase complex dimerization subunit type 1 TsaB [Candidatus Krumholzibacteria bacterium]|nr:tRNA (adenosine(37)-N6)-threonylcarbamoyltransferase complex dimerization subunit type 1 TsaB [Candidatus Krumholzibacteria bacterium]
MNDERLVLALDASHQMGSVAVCRGEKGLGEILFDASDTHSATLLPGVDACLASAKVTLSDVELLAVVYGPGSFTGLRIALATVKAFAAVRRIPVAPVESCAVLAAAFPYAAHPVFPLIDARRGEVYGALYDTLGGSPREIAPPFSAKPETLATFLEAWPVRGPLILCGTGMLRHRAVLESIMPSGSLFAGERWAVPSASLCAMLALARPSVGYEELFALEPLYIRPPDARLPGAARAGSRGGVGR